MKGQIKVKSELNKGTAFIIEIPVNAVFRKGNNNKFNDFSPMSNFTQKDIELLQ